MTAMMHPTRRAALLQNIETPKPLKANPPLQNLEKEDGARLLRQAIAYAGLTPKEAAYLCGVGDAAQFNRMLDGLEKFWVHVLLRKSARPILRELLILVAMQEGSCEVERTIRIKETA